MNGIAAVQARISDLQARFTPPAPVSASSVAATTSATGSSFADALSSATTTAQVGTQSTLTATGGSDKGQRAVELAREHLGKPYVWGGNGPDGFDCSGLTKYVYGQLGADIPRWSGHQATAGQPVASLAEARPGDLISFVSRGAGNPDPKTGVGHVGIYVGDGKMIHAPRRGKPIEEVPIGDRQIYSIRRIVDGPTPGVAATAAPSQAMPLAKSGAPSELAQYGNGKIPASALTSIGIGSHRLWDPAARAFSAMRAEASAAGIDIGVTDSYRDYDTQVDLVRRKGLYSEGGLAARPGTSDHGWGKAVDLKLDSRAQTWMRANAARFGFVEDTPREPWHWAYHGPATPALAPSAQSVVTQPVGSPAPASVSAEVIATLLAASDNPSMVAALARTGLLNPQGATPSATPAHNGSRVLVVGDSLTVGSRDELRSQLREAGLPTTIDATNGRSASRAADAVKAFAPDADDVVVVALGTNDFRSPAALDAAVRSTLAAAGPAKVLWVNVDANGAEAANAALARAAGANPAMEVLDWASAARNANLSRADGIHYGADGYTARANFIADAVTRTVSTLSPAAPGAGGLGALSGTPARTGPTTLTGGTDFFGAGAGSQQVPASVPFADLFNQAGARHNVSPRLLAAVASAESNFNANIRSHAGAQGLMQFMPATAKGMGVNPHDPASSIDGAARLLRGHFEKFGSVELALAAYNAGAGNVRKYNGIPPFAETRKYVPRVLARATGAEQL